MLYPPRWRERYGEEVLEIIAARPLSLAAVIDLAAGAIDAWIHPQAFRAATAVRTEGEATMLAKPLRLMCAGSGPEITAADRRKGGAVVLGGSLTLTVVWMWVLSQFPGNPYVLAMSGMAYFVPLLVSLRYTSLKGRSASAQWTFIIWLVSVIGVMLLGAGWLSSRI